ncbi:unnamed protein product [Paramecium primaurelia]|uniref:Uncharacterized protein n=1 Tax=Paramecium primaurelia TaxID=5886 RepID=A0A8S1K603_PARPR|nr:unnamed protein product [Paramecium primaurelia]
MNYQNNIAGLQNKVKQTRIELKIQSILKNAQDNKNNKIRMDLNGIPISKNSKNYTVNFKQNLCNVYIVENWKKYNILENNNQLYEVEYKRKCMKNCNLF